MPVLDNPRREKFCQLFAQGMTAKKAYAQAGYPGQSQHAVRLRNEPKIKLRIAELKQAAALHASITMSGMIVTFSKLHDASVAAKQFGPAVQAATAIAKLSGLWIDRRELNANVVYAVSDHPMTEAEWDAEFIHGNGAKMIEAPKAREPMNEEEWQRVFALLPSIKN